MDRLRDINKSFGGYTYYGKNKNYSFWKRSRVCDTQEHALPYLQQFVSLEERESTAIVEESTKATPSGKEGKAAVQTKPAKATPIDESPKKSIHARLQEKKKEIAQKPGKDSPQKRVELAW